MATVGKLKWVLFFGGLAMQGCSHAALDRQLDEKLAQETGVKNRAELNQQSTRLIEAAPGLSKDQRSKLIELQKNTRANGDQLRAKSYKLRAVLVDDILSPNFDRDEVEYVKDEIRKTEQQRLSLFYQTVRRANEILGRWTSQRDERADQETQNQMMFEIMGLDYL